MCKNVNETFANHIFLHYHSFDPKNNVQLINISNKSSKLNLLESLEINNFLKNNVNCVRDQVTFDCLKFYQGKGVHTASKFH